MATRLFGSVAMYKDDEAMMGSLGLLLAQF